MGRVPRRGALGLQPLILGGLLATAGAAPQPRVDRGEAAAGSPTPADARPPASAPPGEQPLFPPVKLVRLGLEEGLPQIHVTALAQDLRGFLWIGTQAGGLARYDGAHMVRYESRADDTSTPSSEFITVLAADPGGSLWIGTGDAGLNLYDPATDRFTRFVHDPKDEGSLAFDAVTVLTVSPDGKLYVGLANGGLDRFEPATRTFHRVIEAEDDAAGISAIELLDGARLRVATHGAGIMTVTAATTEPVAEWVPFNAAIPAKVTAMLTDRTGTLWIGSEEDGLYSVAPGATVPVRYLPGANDRSTISDRAITSLLEDREGSLWVGTQDGQNQLDPARRVTRYAHDSEYPLRTATFPKYVTTAFQDRAGVIWFGSLDFGLYKLDPLRRAFHDYEATTEFGIPIAFCEAPDGTLWAGTYGHGLYRLDLAAHRFTAFPSLGKPGADDEVELTSWLTALYCAADGTLWIGGSGLGLVAFDPATGHHDHYLADADGEHGPPADRIEHIVGGADGAIWLATWGGGLARLDPATRAFSIVAATDEKVALPSDSLHRLLFDSRDPQVLWVGAAQGGVTRIDLKTKATQLLRGPGATKAPASMALSSDDVLSLYQDSTQALWIGTDGGGLDRRDPASGAITVFGKAEGLPSDVIYGILPADDGKLWLTSTDGLIVFDPVAKKVVTVYTASDGLNSGEFTQNGYFRSKAGEFFVTGLFGFNHFYPKDIRADPYAPPVVLTGFRVFDQARQLDRPIWATQAIDLSFRDSVFSIDFAALSFAAPERTRFSYMLEGFHDWRTTDRGEATYTNLDGGDYVLRIKAVNRHGLESETPIALKIHVDRPPWARWWAYTIYGALVLGAIAGYLRFQARRVEGIRTSHRLSLVERELELTAAVQAGFLPAPGGFGSGSLTGFGYYRAATSCSGDWWWHEEPAGAETTLIVGDVTGHGAGSAMVTAAVATAFRVQSRLASTPLGARLRVLHDEVIAVADDKYYMTMTALELDQASGKYRLHSAGGLPALSMPVGGAVKTLSCRGNPLGGHKFHTGTVDGSLSPGERLFLFTDGIPEIELSPGRQLGLRKLTAMCRATAGMSLEDSIAHIVREAERHQGGRPQEDDWTLVVVEWRPS